MAQAKAGAASKPAGGASLREQAASARLAKGTRKQRIESIRRRADEIKAKNTARYAEHAEKHNAIGKQREAIAAEGRERGAKIYRTADQNALLRQQGVEAGRAMHAAARANRADELASRAAGTRYRRIEARVEAARGRYRREAKPLGEEAVRLSQQATQKGLPKKEKEALFARAEELSRQQSESPAAKRLERAENLKVAALTRRFSDLRDRRLASTTAPQPSPSLREQAAAHRAKQYGGLAPEVRQSTAEIIRDQRAGKRTIYVSSSGGGYGAKATREDVGTAIYNETKAKTSATVARARTARGQPAPATPTLREQAAAARARKGTPQERAKALQAKAQRRFAYAHKQEESLGRQMDAAARTRNARLVQAEGERSRSERTRLVAEAETYGAKARDIAEKSRRYTKTKTRLMSHRDRIVRAIKSTGASLRG